MIDRDNSIDDIMKSIKRIEQDILHGTGKGKPVGILNRSVSRDISEAIMYGITPEDIQDYLRNDIEITNVSQSIDNIRKNTTNKIIERIITNNMEKSIDNVLKNISSNPIQNVSEPIDNMTYALFLDAERADTIIRSRKESMERFNEIKKEFKNKNETTISTGRMNGKTELIKKIKMKWIELYKK